MVEPTEVGEALFQGIDQGLAVSGEIVGAAIYERIERSYQLKPEEMSEKLETFHRGLQELMGAAAEVMKNLIVKNLKSRLGLNFVEHANWTLLD